MTTVDINTVGAVTLTGKGEAYAVAHADRQAVEAEIERLIALLDQWDGDPDLEPTLGSPAGWVVEDISQQHWSAGSTIDGEIEQTNEDGGDVQDEPHDPDTDLEYSLGWGIPTENTRQGAGYMSAGVQDLEVDNTEAV